MPYCTNCGSEVAANTAFCGYCGKPQGSARPFTPGSTFTPGSNPPIQVASPFDTITPRTASILCYIPVFGVIPAIIILASHRFRTNAAVRFNAFQSVYLFVAWLIVSTAFPIVLLGLPGWGMEHGLLGLMKLGFLICWIVLLVKASQNQQVHLPIIGDLAARSTTEQL
jgi:uncharacterized membrane protein